MVCFGCRAQQHMEQTLDGLCVRVAHNHTFDGLWLRMANEFNRLQSKAAIRVSAHVIQLPCIELCYAVSCRAVLCCAMPCHAVLCCAVPCRAELSHDVLQHAILVPFCSTQCCAVLCCVLPAVQLFGRLDMSCYAVCSYLSATHNADLLHLDLLT